MRSDEQGRVREVAVEAFGDVHIGSLVDALHASWAWSDDLSFVAEIDGELVGQVLYTRAWLDAPQRLVEVLVLSPVGVVPAQQGHGVGTALITESLRTIEAERGEPLVFLEGAPGYYARFGFEAARGCGFRAPSVRIPPPAFQVRRLSRHEPWMTGALVYPDAFWANDAVGLQGLTGTARLRLGPIGRRSIIWLETPTRRSALQRSVSVQA